MKACLVLLLLLGIMGILGIEGKPISTAVHGFPRSPNDIVEPEEGKAPSANQLDKNIKKLAKKVKKWNKNQDKDLDDNDDRMKKNEDDSFTQQEDMETIQNGHPAQEQMLADNKEALSDAVAIMDNMNMATINEFLKFQGDWAWN